LLNLSNHVDEVEAVMSLAKIKLSIGGAENIYSNSNDGFKMKKIIKIKILRMQLIMQIKTY
jgi:hypothetical protein